MSTSAMDALGQVASKPENRYVERARSEGRKTVGFFCSYIPLELLDAAGVLPYRIKGVPDIDIGPGTTYLSSRLCTFSRNALTLALENEYDFLDGFVGNNTCDQIRRTSQNWTIKHPPGFDEFLHVPRVDGGESVARYEGELQRLRSGLEDWLGHPVADGDISEAIVKHNRARDLLRRLSDLRKRQKVPISGAELLTASVAYQQMPVEEFIGLAGELLEERSAAPGAAGRIRVLIAGGMLDDPDYLAFIEEQGLDVVADPVCFGLRCYRDDVDTDEPPLSALARRALTHSPCARMGDSFPRRWEDILGLYRDYDAEGIIFQRLTFCQLWGVDVHNMNPLCEESGIPLLYLEREYGFISTGQVRTRLQAFTELIEGKRALLG